MQHKNFILVLLVFAVTTGGLGTSMNAQNPVPPVPSPPLVPQPVPLASVGKAEDSKEEKAPIPSPPTDDPKKSMVRLLHPGVAERLGLSDEQRAAVQKLIAQRARELAESPEAGWAEIYQGNNDKLRAVLTPEQLKILPKVFDEKTIRFTFKMQAWADVLQWFAEQSGLQLVMDAPPPGTFNYSDQKDYTPNEAVNLLNSVLQTKGYTLVKSDKTLLLFNLKQGPIPLQFVPQVNPAKLNDHGSFEYVSMTIPLERRDQAVVLQSMAAFKGPYCRIDSIPGNQLIITDTAGTMAVLYKVALAVHNPPAPRRPPIVPKPVPLVYAWKTYAVEKNDPKHIEGIFRQFAPAAQILHNPESKKIHVYVPTVTHTNLDSILTMMEDDVTEGKTDVITAAYPVAPHLNSLQETSVHPLAHQAELQTVGTELINILKKTFPTAVVSETMMANKIVILASKAEHEKIQAFLDGLKQAADPANEAFVVQLQHADNKTVIPILKDLYPNISVQGEAEGNKLALRVNPSQRKAVSDLLTQLDVPQVIEERFFKSYPFDAGAAAAEKGHIANLQKIVPKAKVSFNATEQEIVVWGTKEEHKIIEQAVAQLSPDGKTAKKLERYPLRRTEAGVLLPILHRLHPAVTAIHDVKNRSLILEGSEKNLKKIAELLALLDPKERTENDAVVKFYTLQSEPSPVLIQGLHKLVPDCQIVPDKEAKQLMVIAKPSEHVIVAENVKTISATFTAPEEPLLSLYPATLEQKEQLEAFMRTAAKDLKGAMLVPDKNPNQVTVWAKPAEQKMIETVLGQFEESKQNGPKRSLKAFAMSSTDLWTAQQILKTTFPDAVPFMDYTGNRLLIWAADTDIEKMETVLMKQSGLLDRRQMVVYSVAAKEPQTVITMIQAFFNNLKMVADTPNRRILVWASPEEHTKIAQLVEQTNKKDDPTSELAEKFVAYSAANLDTKTVLPLFKTLIPEAEVFGDAASDKITVRARTRDHQKVAELLEQLRQKDETLRPVLAVYPYGETDPVMIEAMLRGQLPDSESMTALAIIQKVNSWFAYEKSPWFNTRAGKNKDGFFKVDPQTQSAFVFVNAEKQKEVAEAMKELEKAGSGQREMLSVSIPDGSKITQEKVLDTLTKIYPDLNPIAGGEANQILVWAPKERLAKIQEAVNKVCQPLPEGQQTILKSYPLQYIDVAEMRRWLAAIYPNASFDPPLHRRPFPRTGPNTDKILYVLAAPAEQSEIEKLIAEFDRDLPAAHKAVLKTYYFKNVPLNEGVAVLNQIYTGQATITARPSTGDILVSAVPEVQQRIAKNIAEFDVPRPEETEMQPIPYDVSEIPSWQLQQVVSGIQQSFANKATVLPSSIPGQLIVMAKPAEQKKIKLMVDSMIAERPNATSRLEIYALNRSSLDSLRQTLLNIVPNVRYGAPIDEHHLPIWAKETEHQKIKAVVDKLNEPEKEMVTETYSLQNIHGDAAKNLIETVSRSQGLDIKYTHDRFTNQLVVQTRPENQAAVKGILEKMRIAERELAVFPLETLDPVTAYQAMNTLFSDEPDAIKPEISVDQNTNVIFVLGTKEQHHKTRNLLIQTGETLRSGNQGAAVPPNPAAQGNTRTIPLHGNTDETMKELEKRWQQQNQLRIIRQEKEPKKETVPAKPQIEYKPVKFETEQEVHSAAVRADSNAPVYVVENKDGTLTITSQDTAALDQAEKMIKKIQNHIVFEGRDYTIFSVRNISATLVSQKMQLILRERLTRRQNATQNLPQSFQPPRLEMMPDETTNTIYVRGSKAERNEAAHLISFLDVSELPGQTAVTKPVKVPIKNTQAIRIWQQVAGVYQQKLFSTRLPGGLMPRVTVDAVTNSLEIIAPEPLSSEIKNYALDIDRRTVEEPVRKIAVIPLEVKSAVVQQAIQAIRQTNALQGDRGK